MIATFMAQLVRRDQPALRFNALSGAIAICRAPSLRVVMRIVERRCYLNLLDLKLFTEQAHFQSKIVQRWQRRWHETSLHFTVRARFAPLHVLLPNDTLSTCPQLLSCDPVKLDALKLRDRSAIVSRPKSS
ncbi:hypothetical protein HG15A2_44550 [Adhaeretor mobilis]|uniref:Uncharacterized protein n=1 Tax=Adhaeretor mobilis TaxID=1930276 RepID=A0A517N1V9_9BACT|nr:hypothetical protein HG15A2_44550 [Adhaeretor mobilis]